MSTPNPPKPMITLGTARERDGLRRSVNAARLGALSRYLEHAPDAEDFTRIARWTALAARARGAFVYLVSRSYVRITGAHGLELDLDKRTLPTEHAVLVPNAARTIELPSDLELFSAVLGLPLQPRVAHVAPVFVAGEVIGGVCALDFELHDLDADARALIGEFAQVLSVPVDPDHAPPNTPEPRPAESGPPPAAAINDPRETQRGRLEHIGGAAALAQLLAHAGRAGRLRLGAHGALFLSDAQIVHAERGLDHPAHAARALLALEDGEFGFAPDVTPPAAGLALHPGRLALEINADPDRDQLLLEGTGVIALPHVTAAVRLVSALGGAGQFSAHTVAHARWSRARLVLRGRGMTLLVVNGTLGEWQAHLAG